MTLRVLIADDHAILRSGVRSLIEATGRCEIVGEAGDGSEAVRLAIALAPDLVIIDISMPRVGGLDAIRELARLPSMPRVIVLSAHGEREYIIEALRAGALGYVLKDAAFDEIRAAIDAVGSGRRYLGSRVSEAALDGLLTGPPTDRGAGAHTPPATCPELALLTAREREVLELIARGHTNDEIGGMLYISAHTVQAHRKRIMEKLGIHRAVDLARFALRHGLAPLE